MYRRVAFAVIALFAVSCAASPVGESGPVVAGNTAFGMDLYAKLKLQSGNVFFSPFSVSTALAMTAAGARGATHDEMAKTLHLPPGDGVHAGFAALLAQLQAQPDAGYELSVANALWGKKGFAFRPEFTGDIAKNYGGGLRQVDFANRAAAAAQINQWVEEQTKNRIKDLIKPDLLDADTRLVLTNAIYFKGKWKSQFRKDMTRDEPFFIADGKSSPVPMMHQGGRFKYDKANGVQLLEMPYRGDRLSMVVLLPEKKFDLASVEAALTPQKFDAMLAAAQVKLGDVIMPRFEFETRYQLNKPLMDMGMTRAFSNNADFTGMSTAEPLKIAFVVHKAFVKVDEEGSEAAAATGVGVKRAASAVEDRFQFRADHPFVFAIRDAQTGSILFLGRVSDAGKTR